MKKIATILLFLVSSTGILKSQTSCATSQPFCANAGATTFPASTNTSAQAGPSYGCLLTQPNPAWYYFQVSTSGSIIISMNGTGGGDVDFICWGPFASPSGNCGNLTAGNNVGCSYSTSSTETLTISNAIAGQYYQLLITNYANITQNINFNQTSGTGSTNCGILSSGVNSATVCANNPTTLTANTNLTSPSFTWNPGGQNTSSISVNPSSTQVYTVTISGLLGAITPTTITQTGTVTVNQTPTIVLPSTVSICPGASAIVTSTVSPAGSYSYNWTTGVTTNSASVNASGVVSLAVTNTANGCINSATCNVMTNPLPVITMPLTQSITCSTPTISIAASVSPATSAPVWTGGVCAGAGSYTASACSAGTYTLTVTDPATGCSASGTISVAAGGGIPSASASNTGSLTCVTATTQIVATTTSTPVSYAWSGPGTISGPAGSTATVSVGGTYTCIVTNTVSGCATTVITTVSTNTTVPVVSITQPTVLTCAVPSVTMSASPTTGVTYTWTGVGILSGSTSSTISAGQQGVYSVTVTDAASGCVSGGTVNVLSNSVIPTLTLSATSLSLTCANTTATVVAATNTPSLSYAWSPGPASGGTTNTPTFNASGIYTLTVNNSSNGCSNTATVSVITNTTIPTITVTPTQTLSCMSPTAIITATVAPNTVTYNWTGPGISGPGTGSSITINQSGTYTVTVLNPVNGCTNTASGTIIAAPGFPSVSVSSMPSNGMLSCITQTVNLLATVNPTANITYNWSTGSTTSNANVSGSCVVTVTVTNTASNCVVISHYTVTSNTTPPALSTPNSTIACDALSATLTAISSGTNVGYNWSGPTAGSIISGGNTSSPTIAGPGNYTVTITDQTNGCSTTTVVTVSQPGIHAAFVANPITGMAPLAVNFTNQSTGATNYNWIFGDGHTSTSVNPAETYTASGTYTVALISRSGGCADTAYTVIFVESGMTIEIPNVFTPNGDNANDVFFIKSTGVKEMSLVIFNRWGEKMHDDSGSQASWNGNTPHGSKVPDGTYFFMVKALGNDGTKMEKQGTVNLYR